MGKSKTTPKLASLANKSEVWIPEKDTDTFERATVVLDKGDGFVSVRRTADNKILAVERHDVHVVDEKVNQSGAKGLHDLVNLSPPNIGNILHSLKDRSTEHDLAYTFVGPVLISINPVIPSGKESSKGPHPHRIAEAAMKQMKFAKMTNQPLDQSIIVSGESGAGKTEASKRVLNQLVQMASASNGKGKKKSKKSAGSERSLDRRLIDTNPILEAFGNATTLRNRNSSRFGKFMKLHVDLKLGSIVGASVETYLLERSRVSGFVQGENNYHVFYSLLGCGDKSLIKELGLTTSTKNYEYLVPFGPDGDRDPDLKVRIRRPDDRDKADYPILHEAFKTIGVKEATIKEVFQVVAGILHLGNVPIEGAKVEDADISPDSASMQCAARFFGVKGKELAKVISEKPVKVGMETIVSKLNNENARQARDAVAKQMYSYLFDWIVNAINNDLSADDTHSDAFVGVLDIFGFETFQYNDLEQLLINYTNEALHGIFLQKVFDAELTMYKTEGLLPEGDNSITVPENVKCLELLHGSTAPTRRLGILDVVVDHGNNPGATDSGMNKELHRQFGANTAYFPRPHPKDVDHMFKVKHFPGAVSYHIGNFLTKNQDRLPGEVETLFGTKSNSNVVTEMWKKAAKASGGGANGRGKKSSIVSKFKTQIQALSTTLNGSQCSFIRCVKPNFHLERDPNSSDWFDVPYINSQLKCLGIEPTVQVLSKGMPSRISYEELTESYKSKLPKDAIKSWKKMGGGDKAFISALFWAFGISGDKYKLGFSKVFFKSGDLEDLERVLDGDANDMKKIGKRFRRYLIRSKWRKVLAVGLTIAHFQKMLGGAREREEKRKEQETNAIVLVQARYRGWKARERFIMLKKKRLFKMKKKREEMQKKLAEDMAEQEKLSTEADAARKNAENCAEEDGRALMLAAMELMEQEAEEETELEQEKRDLKTVRKQRKAAENLASRYEEEQLQVEDELEKQVAAAEDMRQDQELMDADEGRFLMEQAMQMMENENVDDKSLDKAVKKHGAERLKKQAEREAARAKMLREEEEKLTTRYNEKHTRAKLTRKATKKALKAVGSKLDTGEQKVLLDKAVELKRQAAEKERQAIKKKREAEKARLEEEQFAREIAAEEKRIDALAEEGKRKVELALSKQKMVSRFKNERVVDVKMKDDNRRVMNAMVNRNVTMASYGFYGIKRARKSARNWKKRYFMLDRMGRKIKYFKSKGSKLKGVYLLTPDTEVKILDGDGKKSKKNMLMISDPESGELVISLVSEVEQFKVKTNISDTVDILVEESQEDHSSSSGSLKKVNSFETGKKEDDRRKSVMKDEDFVLLSQLLHAGEITEKEFQDIIDNKEEVLMARDELEGIDLDCNIQVTCEQCGCLNNSSKGPVCRICRTQLAVSPTTFL